MATINPKDWLIFIDTNIFLDFYRARNEANVTLLKKVDAIHSQIICTQQVEMEFKKNRQRVIMDSLKEMKAPDGFKSVPAFLHGAKSVEIINKTKKDIEKRVTELRRRSIDALSQPTLKDDVYKIVQRLFADTNGQFMLHFGDEEIYTLVVSEAQKRFMLGYPPRKKDDTSCGDAVNWEWIVHCSKKSSKHVLIVSRDSDYGTIDNDKGFVNDWLQQEFRARTNMQRQIKLTDKLSTALKTYANIGVTKEEIKAEKDQIEESKEVLHEWISTPASNWTSYFQLLQEYLIKNLDRPLDKNDDELR